MKKDQVLATIASMPDEFKLDDLFEQLLFIEKVEQGLQQGKEGKTKPHADVKMVVSKW